MGANEMRAPRTGNMTRICEQCCEPYTCWKHHKRRFCSVRCATNNRYPNPAKDQNERSRRWYSQNKEECRKKVKARYEVKKDEILARARVMYHGRYRDSKLAKIYGISKEKAQHWLSIRVCQICGEEANRMVLDHDHKTGIIRGRLCTNCNSGLGHFKDNSDVLRAAINYLKVPLGFGL